MKRKISILVLIALLAVAVPFSTQAAENLFVMSMDNLVMPNSGLGLIEDGILKAPMDANEYLMLFRSPGVTNDFVFTGSVNLKFIGAQDWTGIRFVVGYKDVTHFTMVRIEKGGQISFLARDPDAGWVGGSDIGEGTMIEPYPLSNNIDFNYKVEKSGHHVKFFIDDVKLFEGDIDPAFDYFTDGNADNVGIFNSKVTINVTEISISNSTSEQSSSQVSSAVSSSVSSAALSSVVSSAVISSDEGSSEAVSEEISSEELSSELVSSEENESSEEYSSEEVTSASAEEISSQSGSDLPQKDSNTVIIVVSVLAAVCVLVIVGILLNKKYNFLNKH